MSDAPPDKQAPRGPNRRHAREPEIEFRRRDVLTPDLRAEAQAQGRDQEDVDPVTDDEDHGRRESLGGKASLD